MNVRAVLLVGLVLAVAGGVALLSSGPDHPGAGTKPPSPPVATGTVPNGGALPAGDSPGAPAASAFTKASQCATCHQAEYDEWKQSMHGRAWTDPMVQALSNNFRMTECIDCHSPMPIHETGISERVVPRQHSRSDGVDCLTCHLLDDGVAVAATRTIDTSKTPGACRPTLVKEMSTPAACAGCHNQHQTVDELAQSGLKETCSDCHMPVLERKMGAATAKPGRSHAWPGAHSLEMHQRAVTLDLAVKDGAVVATVKNVGAGHQVPTDARHRSYNLFVTAWDDHGNPLVADRMFGEFRLYYRDDFKPSTQITYGKSGEGRWQIPEGIKGRVKVRLAYALNPEELAKKNVLDVLEKEIEFK